MQNIEDCRAVQFTLSGSDKSMNCQHKFVSGIAIENKFTDGRTTDSKRWKKGEALHRTNQYRLVYVSKCSKCGASK